jgi:hypothetical protein
VRLAECFVERLELSSHRGRRLLLGECLLELRVELLERRARITQLRRLVGPRCAADDAEIGRLHDHERSEAGG